MINLNVLWFIVWRVNLKNSIVYKESITLKKELNKTPAKV